MTLTTEIFIFETTDAFRTNPEIGNPAFDLVLKENGAHSPAYYGVEISESPKAGYVFINWDSYEAHKAVIDGPSYPDIIAALKPSLGGAGGEIYHVKFSSPPTVALGSPVTEVFIFTLKAPENRAAVVDILSKFSEASGNVLAFGQTREDENKYVLVCGWSSVEAHLETAAKPEVAAGIDKLYTLVDKDRLYHAKLSQYPL